VVYLTKNGLLASDSCDDFRGGAPHCFCPRAPKTPVTPLSMSQAYMSRVTFFNLSKPSVYYITGRANGVPILNRLFVRPFWL